jgi:hypothetical protein
VIRSPNMRKSGAESWRSSGAIARFGTVVVNGTKWRVPLSFPSRSIDGPAVVSFVDFRYFSKERIVVLKGEVSGRRILKLEIGNMDQVPALSSGSRGWTFQGNTGCLPTRIPHGLGLWRGPRGRGVPEPRVSRPMTA